MYKKCSIADAKQLATKNGGECVSDHYINIRTKMRWRCKLGHTWETSLQVIKEGSWCPRCAFERFRDNIETYKKLAKSKGGECLSKEYLNSMTPLEWKCSEGHMWKARPVNIKCGYWCPKCSYLERAAGLRKHDLPSLKKLAQERGGDCLSRRYINNKSKLLWRCIDNHKWRAKVEAILNGQWCPTCSSNRSERVCREYFERIFSKKFPKSKPIWLLSPQKTRMELDGYCQELKLAFEYQGKQHYRDAGIFHRNMDLKTRKQYDKMKNSLCKEHNVTLLRIPYTVALDKLGNYIIYQCKLRRAELVGNITPPDYKTFNIYTYSEMSEMQSLARDKEGICLSKYYINSKTNLLWQCKNGHIWKANPDRIRRGAWCATCANVAKLSIEDMIQYAHLKGGECLSRRYKNAFTKLHWKCAHGHQFLMRPNDIQQGRWCNTCGRLVTGNKLRVHSIEEMQKLAAVKGGFVLSKEYKNTKTKLRLKCAFGHEWTTVAGALIRGQWCKRCAGFEKHTIEDMSKLAELKMGKCLSLKYINNKTKLLWECQLGHRWEAKPNSIVSGQWCPKCAQSRRSKQGFSSL